MTRVNIGSQFYLPPTHASTNVMSRIPAFTLQPQSITALWLVFISRPAEDMRLSTRGWLHIEVVCPPADGHPFQH